MALLKAGRAMQLVTDLGHVTAPGREALPIPRSLLERALGHASVTLRMDVVQLACVFPRLTVLPGTGFRISFKKYIFIYKKKGINERNNLYYCLQTFLWHEPKK